MTPDKTFERMTSDPLLPVRIDLAERSQWNIGYFISGFVFWVYVTVTAYLLPLDTARFYWLAGTFLIFPCAVAISRLLRADPFSKGNALGELVGYTHMSVVALTLPLVVIALFYQPHTLTLFMAICYCIDFYVMSWAFGTRLFGLHAAMRTVLVTGVWFAWPQGSSLAIPIIVALAYLTTVILIPPLRTRWLLEHELRSAGANAA
jgi:hypothetical protein